ncbi:hypothetical protein M413DRAFT_81087 [Hebeloma cylindrosporum]|uniref:DUF7918 domain-containing protein n=1 Tax=Hebeloma cylindrosporum TaxID=76867 RepID=A0A0C3CWM4_HEBCY|nr:hypothetical protein M413DRAFT_81087 [Hebeloma cylindrosporum h7]
MPTVDNFSVWIEVEGKQLPEYQVQSSVNEDQSVRTCWIPSEAGKEFRIVYRDSLREIDTCTRILVDGVPCSGLVQRPIAFSTAPDTIVHDGQSASATTYKPYVFSNCQLTEHASTTDRAAASLGEIVVGVEHVLVTADNQPWASKVSDLPPLRIHERAKKGIVHGTQLGKEVPRSVRTTTYTTTIRKLVSFHFKYRPLEVLKADGIVPRDKPTSVKRPADPEDIIDLTLEDDCSHCQCGARKRKKAKVSKSVKTDVKRERPVMFGDGEVLDLTI